mmetsp:Transcript_22672/g.19689  ORF Transcript_22672/g.19689 Transcript_22672/m.19689 type:complete len:222 (-) Transcript_22672:953-1618(-)|eukprot:CAMPEP_0114588324 /NCGR_PEP_ID=MMETSP0125-20121206/11050_1 /TAXON_ID=485358 ORGANISM="Aristerostoma sp., Strain ATCC 50986" /NCGR_SAMPLE_ID=MMETSP0125 /ASSEMBLY_ACC=CAM_ASM_000245 /LENGTH=221 /DNA_ID=CAMNT_0001784653 /DNA_START=373 /DNA_END=1038 /DNA_ORIENTATION=-
MPTNKGEIFSSGEFTLLEKRNLFKLLHSCAGLYNRLNKQEIDINSTAEFDKNAKLSENEIQKAQELKDEHYLKFLKEYKISDYITQLLTYVIVNYQYNLKDSDQKEFFLSTKEFIDRVNKFLRSAGIHSSYPFLYTNYGTSDILQGFSRSSAVFGSLFIVNSQVNLQSVHLPPKQEQEEVKEGGEKPSFKVKSTLAGKKEYLTSELLVLNKDYLSLVEGAE